MLTCLQKLCIFTFHLPLHSEQLEPFNVWERWDGALHFFIWALFLLCWKEKLRNNIVIIYSSDPRGVSKFLVSAVFFFVYISFCLVQLRFSSCDWERKFPDSNYPWGLFADKSFCSRANLAKLVKLVSPVAKNTPSWNWICQTQRLGCKKVACQNPLCLVF